VGAANDEMLQQVADKDATLKLIQIRNLVCK